MTNQKVFADLVQVAKRRYFTNRETELGYFVHMLENAEPDYRILMLHGMGGIGKSMILDKYQQECQTRNVPYLSIDCSELRTAEDFLLGIRAKLNYLIHHQAFFEFRLLIERFATLLTKGQQLDKRLVQNNLSSGNPAHTDDLLSSPADEVNRELSSEDQSFLRNGIPLITSAFVAGINVYSQTTGRFVLFLDTYETVTDLLDQWIRSSLVQTLPENVRVVIAGRKKLDPAWNIFNPIVKTIEIVTFKAVDIENYLTKRGVANKFVAEIFNLTAGHPLSLALAIDFAGERFVGSTETEAAPDRTDVKLVIVEAILETILNRITDPRLFAIIEACAVLRTFDETSVLYLLRYSQHLRQSLLRSEEKEYDQAITLELHKRLQVLELQKARMGISCPPHIEVEIAELKQRLSPKPGDDENDLIKISHWAIEELRRLSFTIIRSQMFALHDLVREYVVAHLKSKRPNIYQELNKIALDWYSSQLPECTGDEWYRLMLEILHHTLALDENKGVELFARLFVDITLSFRTKLSEALVAEMKNSHLETELSKDWIEYAETRLLLLQGQWAQREQQLEKLAMRSSLSPTVKVWVLADLGSVHRQRGRTEIATKTLQRCVLLARQIGERRGLWESLFEIAKIYRTTNDWAETLRAYNEALQLSKVLQDVDREAKVYLHIGAVYNLQGKWRAAEEAYANAMSLFEESRNEYGIARTFFNLGWAQMFLGKWEEAEISYQSCIDMSQRLGAAHSLVSALLGLGNLKLFEDAIDEAHNHLTESLKLSQDLNYHIYMGGIHQALGRVIYAKLQFEQAIEYYQRAIESFSDQGDTLGEASVRVDLAVILKRLGLTSRATSTFREAILHLKESSAEYQLLRARLVGVIELLDDSTSDTLELIEADAIRSEYFDLASQAAMKLFEISLHAAELQNDLLNYARSTLKCAGLYNSSFLYTQCKAINSLLKSLPLTDQQKWFAYLEVSWPLDLDKLNLPGSTLRRVRKILLLT